MGYFQNDTRFLSIPDATEESNRWTRKAQERSQEALDRWSPFIDTAGSLLSIGANAFASNLANKGMEMRKEIADSESDAHSGGVLRYFPKDKVQEYRKNNTPSKAANLFFGPQSSFYSGKNRKKNVHYFLPIQEQGNAYALGGTVPATVKYNNPYNVKFSNQAGHVGGKDSQFWQGEKLEHGVLLGMWQILRYFTGQAAATKGKKINTIKKFANIYAPKTENDTDQYIKNISKLSGIKPDEVIDYKDPEVFKKFFRAVGRAESSYTVPDDLYNVAYSYGMLNHGNRFDPNVSIEVEGGEVAKFMDGSAIEFVGPNHNEGGIDISVPSGTEIFSKRIKHEGKTMAQREMSRQNAEQRIIRKMSTGNPWAGTALSQTMRHNERHSAEDMAIQEIIKQQQQVKRVLQNIKGYDLNPNMLTATPPKYAYGGSIDYPNNSRDMNRMIPDYSIGESGIPQGLSPNNWNALMSMNMDQIRRVSAVGSAVNRSSLEEAVNLGKYISNSRGQRDKYAYGGNVMEANVAAALPALARLLPFLRGLIGGAAATGAVDQLTKDKQPMPTQEEIIREYYGNKLVEPHHSPVDDPGIVQHNRRVAQIRSLQNVNSVGGIPLALENIRDGYNRPENIDTDDGGGYNEALKQLEKPIDNKQALNKEALNTLVQKLHSESHEDLNTESGDENPQEDDEGKNRKDKWRRLLKQIKDVSTYKFINMKKIAPKTMKNLKEGNWVQRNVLSNLAQLPEHAALLGSSALSYYSNGKFPVITNTPWGTAASLLTEYGAFPMAKHIYNVRKTEEYFPMLTDETKLETLELAREHGYKGKDLKEAMIFLMDNNLIPYHMQDDYDNNIEDYIDNKNDLTMKVFDNNINIKHSIQKSSKNNSTKQKK